MRMTIAASELFRRQGYSGTGLNQILSESEAPRGSLYFHFPGGKAELGVDAVNVAGRAIGDGIQHLLDSSATVGEAIGRVAEFLAADLRESDWERGCPIAMVALDTASTSEPIRLACRAVFDDWLDMIERQLRVAGRDGQAAADEALTVVSALEGALMLARSRRDTAPLDAVSRFARKSLAGSDGCRRDGQPR